ncbi:ABC transporter ATP-binding protein [Thomasclavelia saccharogumia]|uniref:ABC transporter ATP-binding protein n=1 Tax=Thomasclavelia saccharogumia TaxID=341225 RepID=UPI00047CE1CB|nr:ABC transporter ATP-binding protein [Thomasclavelia saccharogumia]
MYLELREVQKYYGEGENRIQVLKGVNGKIEKGEICVMLGPSGSGKSTLLNLIGGIETIDSGKIIVDSIDISTLSKAKLGTYRRDTLGFVFQFYHLVPNLTVKENIETGAYLSKDSLSVEELLNKLGLSEHRNKYPNQLSGGQQQRTAIGRALAKNPKLLLCDEPTGALDYYTSKDILELLEQINHDYGTTILIVTHNDAISKMAQRILRLHDGQIISNSLNSSRITAKKLEW